MRYAFIRKQVYNEELKHESNSASFIMNKALVMPIFVFEIKNIFVFINQYFIILLGFAHPNNKSFSCDLHLQKVTIIV